MSFTVKLSIQRFVVLNSPEPKSFSEWILQSGCCQAEIHKRKFQPFVRKKQVRLFLFGLSKCQKADVKKWKELFAK